MADLPSPISDYLLAFVSADRSLAYLCADESGRLVDWGGHLEVFGISNLQRGESVGNQAFFLEGLLPLTDSPLVLPRVKTERGRSADLHIFRQNGQDWVLLLDATANEMQSARAQQKAHELSLLREKESRILDQYFGMDATQALVRGSLLFEERGQRLETTVLFADLLGFTLHSKRDPAEVVVETFGSYLRTIKQIIQDEAGLADQSLSSAIVAVFGAVSSADSPPNRAIQAAFRVVETVKGLNEIRQRDLLSAFDVSIGITSGPSVLGFLGQQERKVLCVIGATAYRAARFQSVARANEILIDEETFQRIDGFQERFSEIILPPQLGEGLGKSYSCLVRQ